MAKNKTELMKNIKSNIQHLASNRDAIDEVKSELSKYQIPAGRVEEYLSNPDILLEDQRELALFTEQAYLKTGLHSLNPEDYFTKHEMKESYQFDYMLTFSDEEIEFPLVLSGVTHLGNNLYAYPMEIKTIAQLMKSKKLNYNFEIQRQEKSVKRSDGIMRTPTVYKKNVKEIKDLLLKDQLIHTTVAFNAATNTSDSGEELSYDGKKMQLTINEGTRLDILDGYHRCLASEQAYKENPELDFKFMVLISNYTTRMAQQYQAQLAKATPIPSSRIQELEMNRLSDTVVKILKSESELRDRVATTNAQIGSGSLVSYRVLADAIDREFPSMKTQKDARQVAQYLTDFFEELIGNYPEEFLAERKHTESLRAYNKMFAGYIALAAEMKKENVSLEDLEEILDKVDFSKKNRLWQELEVLDSDGHIKGKVNELEIAKYFKNIVKETVKS